MRPPSRPRGACFLIELRDFDNHGGSWSLAFTKGWILYPASNGLTRSVRGSSAPEAAVHFPSRDVHTFWRGTNRQERPSAIPDDMRDAEDLHESVPVSLDVPCTAIQDESKTGNAEGGGKSPWDVVQPTGTKN